MKTLETMMIRLSLSLFIIYLLLFNQAKAVDPYKVLGVEKNASQRQIQKAFHKLSLQYHPDKNKSKGAQEKFTEINNAYEILSDEEKRKNYELYGDEKARPTFDGGNYKGQGGNTYFTHGGQGNSRFSFRSVEWQRMGNSRPFFSFGRSGASGSTFNFGFNNDFSDLFSGGSKGGNQFAGNQYGSFSSSGNSRSASSSPKSIKIINSQVFKKEIAYQGLSWLLLFYTPSAKGFHVLESIVEDVANLLDGAMKAGSVNCQSEQSLCKDLKVLASKSAQILFLSYKTNEIGSLVEYSGDLDAKQLKSFCQDQLPRFSKRVDVNRFDFSSSTFDTLPKVLLLSKKKDTPVIWRALSGLYHKRFVFYDAETHDLSEPMVQRLGIDALPAVVGILSNGEKHVLKTGIVVKDLKSGISEIKVLLDRFEKKNKEVSSQAKRSSQTNSQDKTPYITSANMDSLCGDKTAVCIIGVFRSSKDKEKLESLISFVSQKTLARRQSQFNYGDSVSYMLLDATKQPSFLNCFDESGFKSLDKLLLGYRPLTGKFAVFSKELTLEEVEKFISKVLNWDIQFTKIRQKPLVK